MRVVRLPMMDQEPLIQWLAATALGDRAAYRRLYDATAPKLFAIALRIVRDEGRAEDILQESFMNVWNGAARYNASLAAPMTWMTAIVRNRCLDALRRNDHRAVALDDDLIAVLESDQRPPDVDAGLKQAALDLDRCLRRLDPGQRQAIFFAYFQGLTHSELAATLRVPIGTIKTWIRRGLEKMKRCLEAPSLGEPR